MVSSWTKNLFHSSSSLFQDSRLRSLGEVVSSCQVHFERHPSNYLSHIYHINIGGIENNVLREVDLALVISSSSS